MGAVPGSPSRDERMRPSFLLVHGACHGGWCWERVVACLEASGARAEAIDLPGHGAHSCAPDTVRLADSVAAIRQAVARLPEPPVLVGHSWGGFPVTMAAGEDPAAVAGLAYLAAYLPVERESFTQARSPEGSREREGAVEWRGDSRVIRPERARALLYHDVPEPWATRAIERLEPEPWGPQEEKVHLAGGAWRALPKLYLRTEDDRMIPPAWQDRMAGRGAPVTVHSLAGGHSPFLSRPGEIAAALLDRFGSRGGEGRSP